MTEADARILASDIANRYLAGKTFNTGMGGQFAPPHIEPDFWLVVEKSGDRWHLSHDAPSGFYLAVSFAEDGSDPEVERAGFASV